jgi:NAD(P)-dependent dehydrogenase (short-subunit alcohol dehydrogenase family)
VLLTGRAALVTGGKRIGLVVARELAARGVDVALGYAHSKAEADEAAGLVRSAGRRAVVIQANLADPPQCAALVERAVTELGRLDILINMASVYKATPFADLTPADWNASIDVDLRSAFLCAHAAAPHMQKQGGGHIINFGDWLARSGRPRYSGYLSYYVAKAGVIALTEALALELAGDHILVNCIAPGPILAPPGTSDEESGKVEQVTPLGRWGGEIEIAKAVLGLLDSDFITGEAIRVDGGRHLR